MRLHSRSTWLDPSGLVGATLRRDARHFHVFNLSVLPTGIANTAMKSLAARWLLSTRYAWETRGLPRRFVDERERQISSRSWTRLSRSLYGLDEEDVRRRLRPFQDSGTRRGLRAALGHVRPRVQPEILTNRPGELVGESIRGPISSTSARASSSRTSSTSRPRTSTSAAGSSWPTSSTIRLASASCSARSRPIPSVACGASTRARPVGASAACVARSRVTSATSRLEASCSASRSRRRRGAERLVRGFGRSGSRCVGCPTASCTARRGSSATTRTGRSSGARTSRMQG